MPDMREVEVRVTNRCSALCAHCGVNSAPTEEGALALSVAERLLDEFLRPMAGTVWLKPETLAAVLRDTVRSLYAQGLRKVLVVNGHGGNLVLRPKVRRLNLAHPDGIVLLPPTFAPCPGEPRIWEQGDETNLLTPVLSGGILYVLLYSTVSLSIDTRFISVAIL